MGVLHECLGQSHAAYHSYRTALECAPSYGPALDNLRRYCERFGLDFHNKAINPSAVIARGGGSELPLGEDARLGQGVLAVLPGAEGSGGIHRQGVEPGRELVVMVDRLVPGDDLAGVAGHAAHDLTE